MTVRVLLHSALAVLMLCVASCGSTQRGGRGGGPEVSPRLTAEHLPSHLNWVRFGATTLEEARGHFTAENLYVTESLDASMGGEREQIDRTRGPNAGIHFNRLAVTRSQTSDGFTGDLGDNYGNISFYFSRMPGNDTPVLFRMDVSQPTDSTPSICEPASALGDAPEALQGCSDRIVLNAGQRDDGGYTFCVGDAEGEHQMLVHCRAGNENMGRGIDFVLLVPGVNEGE